MPIYIIAFLLIHVHTCAYMHIFPILIIISIQTKTKIKCLIQENNLSYKVPLIFFQDLP